MFKTIFTTLMLCTSIGTPLIKQPQKVTGANTVYGFYCLRNEFVAPTSFVDYDYQQIYNWGEYGAVRGYLYDYSSSYGNYVSVRHIDLGVSDTDVSFYVSFGEDYLSLNTDLSETDGISYYSSDSSNDRYRYFVLYFPTPTYIDNIALMYFKALFTGEGNSYVSYYNGYYNVGAYPMANTGIPTYEAFGNFIVNNNIYTQWSYYTNGTPKNITAYGVGGSQVIYENNAFKITDRNILIQTTLFPQPILNYLSNSGTFVYVPPTETNDFADLIFSIMDAPVYYLTSLFSFELFGVQFYIAFMSIVTLLLIVAVVRKVI